MNSDPLNNPHDKFFKESFCRKEVAVSFIKEYLPESIANQLDYNSLKILKDTFIDKELAEHFSDILYSSKIAGRHSYIYLLFEHKSYVDPWAGFQLLRNMVKIWESYRKQHKRAQKLPVIIPILIYHGKEKWHFESSIIHLFNDIPYTQRYIPDFKTEIYDISHISDDSIKGEILLRIVFLMQKYIFSPKLFEKLPEIFSLLVTLSKKSKSTEYMEVLLRYLFSTVDSADTPIIAKEIKKSLKYGGSIMPTIAEKWIQEGIEKGVEKGIQEGIQKGVEKGVEKGKVEVAEKMVRMGMTTTEIRKMTGLKVSKIAEIRNRCHT